MCACCDNGTGEELLETVRELRRQVQLKQTILNHFVPQDEHYKVEHDQAMADMLNTRDWG